MRIGMSRHASDLDASHRRRHLGDAGDRGDRRHRRHRRRRQKQAGEEEAGRQLPKAVTVVVEQP